MSLTEERVLEILKTTEAMQEGHFLLTSGRHSNRYVQCARLFEYANYSSELCSHLAEKFNETKIDLVIGPAMGGVIMSYEMSRILGIKNIFAEREDGAMVLRRGFELPVGANILIVEDVITTGGSVAEVIDLVKKNGCRAAGVAVIVDRSGGTIDFGCKLESVLSLQVKSWPADECPICSQGLPLIKPGSRKVN